MGENIFLGTKQFDGTKLSDIWHREVDNERIAWYVDYYTEDAEQFGVRYLAPGITMTNENKDQRDPNDKSGSQWGGDDVAEWFGKDGVVHKWVFIFNVTDCGETFGIACESNRVFAFGPAALSLPQTNLWDEYVEHGIWGAIRSSLMGKDVRLIAAVEDGNFATLTKHKLHTDYLLGLASILDG